MKTTMNLTTLPDDTGRFQSREDLKKFYMRFGCAGLELMPCHIIAEGKSPSPQACPLIDRDMVVGVHICCINDWMNLDRDFLLEYYRRQLDYARDMQAEYVVFHVTQVDDQEGFTYRLTHSDEEVVLAACSLINSLLDGQDYGFHFLMENLWWAGLNFCHPSTTRLLLQGVHYEKKGLMLDTGHYLHTNHALRTPKEALSYLHRMLGEHKELLPHIKGVHLQQSLTGEYVTSWLKEPHVLPSDPKERFLKVYEHIFAIDKHQPFTEPGVKKLVERIAPMYVTYEYITNSREELARYLEAGSRALR